MLRLAPDQRSIGPKFGKHRTNRHENAPEPGTFAQIPENLRHFRKSSLENRGFPLAGAQCCRSTGETWPRGLSDFLTEMVAFRGMIQHGHADPLSHSIRCEYFVSHPFSDHHDCPGMGAALLQAPLQPDRGAAMARSVSVLGQGLCPQLCDGW